MTTATTSLTNNPYGVSLYLVSTPSGSDLELQTPEEANWYVDRRDLYMRDHAFTNISDVMDLDRLLILEILCYRWALWMGRGFDYLMARVDESDLTKKIREYSVEIRLLKVNLGIDKATRNKDRGESSAEYIEKLLERAQQFGYHRNEQYATAVTLLYELASLVRTFDRCDPTERELLDLSYETIFDWIRQKVLLRWDELANNFRKVQTVWIRDL